MEGDGGSFNIRTPRRRLASCRSVSLAPSLPLASDRARWTDRYARALGDPAAPSLVARRAPSAWVVARCLELPAHHVIVDVAGGDGRHARTLAERGRLVVAVDFVEPAVAAARAGRPAVLGVVADAGALPFAPATLDAVLVTYFLERALFPHLAALLRPGGALVAETFTVDHLRLAERGGTPSPRSPDHLLRPGELPALVAPLEVRAYHEGPVRDEAGERVAAGVVAVKR